MFKRNLLTDHIFCLAIFLTITSSAQLKQKLANNDYLGFPKPGSTPEVFAPDFISTQYAEFAGTFSPDFLEYYFTRRGPFPNGLAQIMVTKNIQGTWSEPTVAEFSSNNYEFEPFITPDGQRLYFGSRRSPDGVTPSGTMHQWYLEKVDTNWSEPNLLGSPFLERMVMYPTVSNNGTIYFTGLDGIYYSELVNDIYQSPIKMGPEINYLPLTAHSFIPPDESYLIFDGQPRGEGKSDLYVSYKKQDGSWTKGKPFGKEINSGESQAIASVSPDGECLFFTRDSDIYWVDAAIIDEIKLIPTFIISPDSGVTPLNINISADLSTVPDSIVSFEWDLNNDGTIDSYEQNPEFTFTEPGIFSIKLNVFTESDSSSKTFIDVIEVMDNSTGVYNNDIKPKFELHQNYPNPFNPSTTISFTIPSVRVQHAEPLRTNLVIYDLLGREVATLVNQRLQPGNHQVYFDASNLTSGTYFYKLTNEKFHSTKKMLLLK